MIVFPQDIPCDHECFRVYFWLMWVYCNMIAPWDCILP